MFYKEVLLVSLPFGVSQLVYWLFLYIPTTNPSLLALTVKCLPVLSLASYIWMRKKLASNLESRIMLGLLFSIVGDACLVFEQLFIPGMLGFAVAQICYIRAFGFKPLKPLVLVFLVLFSLVYFSFVLPNISDPVIFSAFPVYGSLLMTMAWRAIARMDGSVCSAASGLGAILFVVSDAAIGIDKFYLPLSKAQEIIMSTYYAAQFAITLSAVEEIAKVKKERKP